MKKRLNISWLDFILIKTAVVFGTLWIFGLIFSLNLSSPDNLISVIQFLVNKRWIFLILAIVFEIKPLKTIIYYNKKNTKGVKPSMKNVIKKQSFKKIKSKKKK